MSNTLHIDSSQTSSGEQLHITVKKLGPIEKADIRLSPLTIFFGKNNTGKTYLSYMLWGILSSHKLQHPQEFIESFHNPKIADTSKLMANFVVELLMNIKDSKKNSFKREFLIEGGISKISITPKFIQKIFNHKVTSVSKSQINISIDPPILNNIELSVSLLEDDTNIAEIVFSTILSDIISPSIEKNEQKGQHSMEDLSIFLKGNMIAKSSSLLEKGGEKLEHRLKLYVDPEILNQLMKKSKKTIRELQKTLSNYFYWYLVSIALFYVTKDRDGVFIPASKSGLGLIRKDLYARGIEVWFSKEKTKKTPNLPYPLIHYLQNLAIMGAGTSKNKKFKKIVKFLENNLIQGTIYYDEQRDDIIYKPKKTNTKLPMSIASSLVVETIPLIAFLKYGTIKENSVVILEEPESHLHPEAQRILTRGIVKLVNKGVHVVLVTHSPYIIQQLNNNIRLYYLQRVNIRKFQKFLEEHEWGRDEILEPKMVSAYLFDQKDNTKTIVRALTVTSEEGISYEAFYEPLYKLRKETNELRRLIEEARYNDQQDTT